MQEKYNVTGMTCPACSAAVEKAADGRSSQEPATVWSSQWAEE